MTRHDHHYKQNNIKALFKTISLFLYDERKTHNTSHNYLQTNIRIAYIRKINYIKSATKENRCCSVRQTIMQTKSSSPRAAAELKQKRQLNPRNVEKQLVSRDGTTQ